VPAGERDGEAFRCRSVLWKQDILEGAVTGPPARTPVE